MSKKSVSCVMICYAALSALFLFVLVIDIKYQDSNLMLVIPDAACFVCGLLSMFTAFYTYRIMRKKESDFRTRTLSWIRLHLVQTVCIVIEILAIGAKSIYEIVAY